MSCQSCNTCPLDSNNAYATCRYAKSESKKRMKAKAKVAPVSTGNLYWNKVIWKSNMPFALLNYYKSIEILRGAKESEFKLTY